MNVTKRDIDLGVRRVSGVAGVEKIFFFFFFPTNEERIREKG